MPYIAGRWRKDKSKGHEAYLSSPWMNYKRAYIAAGIEHKQRFPSGRELNAYYDDRKCLPYAEARTYRKLIKAVECTKPS